MNMAFQSTHLNLRVLRFVCIFVKVQFVETRNVATQIVE
jgi:hypothetical protein